jgi:glycosyltransferase involved in cell wall biosynthesis
MKFSIVTPNYGYGRFLKKNLQSVLEQTSSPDVSIEHIVIDGGSTDDSVSILKDWADFAAAQPAAKDGRYSFSFVSEPDDGQTDAINKGLRRATGDVVAWLNADEWYLPGKLALVAAAFAKYPKTDFLYGEPLFVDKDGNPIRIRRAHRFSKFVLYGCCCYIASCASFWRRRVLDAGHYLDPSYKVIMDGEYYCRLSKAGYRFRFLPATVAAFAFHDENAMLVNRKDRSREWRQLRRMYCPAPRFLVREERRFQRSVKWLGRQWHRVLVVFRLTFQPVDKVEQ